MSQVLRNIPTSIWRPKNAASGGGRCPPVLHPYYSIVSVLEYDGLISLSQQIVNTDREHGRFDVTDVLYGRSIVSSFCKGRAAEIKKNTIWVFLWLNLKK